jgi:hypothetical protein
MGDVELDQLEIALGFVMQLRFEFVALMIVMNGFDRLLKSDGDEQADADGGDVDEEVSPGGGGVVGGVDVEHGGALLRFIGV